MAGPLFQFFILATLASRFAIALPTPELLTLSVPIGESVAVSASIAGVDSQGDTTYILTASDPTNGAATATIVAGSNYISMDAVNQHDSVGFNFACGLDGTNVACTAPPQPGATSTDVFTVAQSALDTLVLDVAPTPTGKPNSSKRMSYSIFTASAAIGLPLALRLF
ncbi:hypothetical protein MVEN_01889500 [Mycena venus]|uniref:Uncharacterized protein n=1 Tax=Mycena venus TaxID=2733690 RepID=A0A8H6XHB8_9AGAR|nr:hypothetical protein MVEN_01889500 [Mycena venus]